MLLRRQARTCNIKDSQSVYVHSNAKVRHPTEVLQEGVDMDTICITPRFLFPEGHHHTPSAHELLTMPNPPDVL